MLVFLRERGERRERARVRRDGGGGVGSDFRGAISIIEKKRRKMELRRRRRRAGEKFCARGIWSRTRGTRGALLFPRRKAES